MFEQLRVQPVSSSARQEAVSMVTVSVMAWSTVQTPPMKPTVVRRHFCFSDEKHEINTDDRF